MNHREYMCLPLYKKLGEEKGIVAVEFSFVIVIFLFMVFFIFEISRYMFISSTIDFMLSSAARTSASRSESNTDYNELFRKTITTDNGFWAGFIDPSLLATRVTFCDTVAQAVANQCSAADSDLKKLAVYQVSYRYQPLILSGVPGAETLVAALKNSLSRQIIYVQEYETNAHLKDM